MKSRLVSNILQVRGLPKLEFINFGSLGRVISGDEFDDLLLLHHHRPTRLRYFSELDPANVDVARLRVLCPHLSHLSLSVPISFEHATAAGAVGGAAGSHCDRVLTALAESDLPLRVLELQHFPCGEPFKRLLRTIGPRLEELLFRANGSVSWHYYDLRIVSMYSVGAFLDVSKQKLKPCVPFQLNSSHVSFVGQHCPGLRRLHLKELGPEDDFYHLQGSANSVNYSLFPALESLHLSGRMWSPDALLPMLLSSAGNIASVSLLNMSYRPTMDGAFARLLQRGALSSLRSLSLYSGCFLSLSYLRRLVFRLPHITSLSFLQFDGIGAADVDALVAEASAMNLDIIISCLELSAD